MASTLSLLVICVFFAMIEARVISTDKLEVPPEGLTLKIIIKPDAEGKMRVQVKSVDKGRRWRYAHNHSKPENTAITPKPEDDIDKVQIIENRSGIQVGQCPEGYKSTGGYCFKDYDS